MTTQINPSSNPATPTSSTATFTATPPRGGKPTSRVRWPLLLLGLGALVFSALLVLYGLSRAAHRTSVWKVTRDVGVGQPITADALGAVGVATDDGTSQLITIDDNTVVGKLATHALRAGALLNRSDLDVASVLGDGQRAVGAVLRPGRIPLDVQRGDRVLVAPSEGDTAGAVPAIILDIRGIVSTTQTGNGAAPAAVRQGIEVILAVDSAAAPGIAQLAANDKLVIVREPRG